MSDATKDTIYIDVDDEITSIIDKVKSSKHRVIALVLPKRAAVLQSVVNMKLLKRAVDQEKKNVVLITSEASLLPLAGAAGLYVAKTLQSKPEIPEAPATEEDISSEQPLEIDEPQAKEFDPEASGDKPVGELAQGTASSVPPLTPALIPDEDIELDDSDLENEDKSSESAATTGKKPAKEKKNKKLKVPNFILFRRILLIGFLVLIALLIFALSFLPKLDKASVSIQTTTSKIPTNLTLNLSPGTNSLDVSSLTVPATTSQKQQQNSAQVPTTGTQNNGTKATGQVTLALIDCSQGQETIPAGTGVVSNGLTFITQSSVTLYDSYNGKAGCNPQSDSQLWSQTVNVTAQSGGTSYNIRPATFTVAGFNNVTGTSQAAMSGGTDSNIQVVAQADVDNATKKIGQQDSSSIKQTLENDLQQQGLLPIPATFSSGTPTVSTTPSVGTEANNVTVTQTVTYTMLGVHQSDIQTLIDSNVNQQINPSQQQILDDGAGSATYTLLNQNGGTDQITMQANSVVGPNLNTDNIKQQILGMKTGDVESTIKKYPGVVNVSVHLSPFWVSSVPKNASRVTVTINKS